MNESMIERDGVVNPRIPLEDTIIYELHVRGYTIDPSSGVRHPGTFAGLAEKIDYLKWLGITAVELLPVDEFDENDCPFVNPLTGERLKNYWGYNPISFGAPKAAYALNPERSEPWDEFCGMVDAFHRRGIEVILDIVFNHTAEGGRRRPDLQLPRPGQLALLHARRARPVPELLRLRQHLQQRPPGRPRLHRGLPAELGRRGRGGRVPVRPGLGLRPRPPGQRPRQSAGGESDLRGFAALRHQADRRALGRRRAVPGGDLPGGARWSDWNGRYRDDVRRFWRGEPGMTSALATRLCGSDDLYSGRGPLHSINFLCCHDGFTLYDLVSYNQKHNEANGEGNRDGNDANWSWNCGAEGPTKDPAVNRLRERQARNLMATLLVSQGVPMILGGDEFLRTQKGNNNAWCQDNSTSWVDWTLKDRNAGFLRFIRKMIAFRKAHPTLRRRTFFTGGAAGGPPEILWHGVEPCHPDFSRTSQALAFALDGRCCDRPGTVDSRHLRRHE